MIQCRFKELMNKTPLTFTTTKKFDLKFLIVGVSGSGKTHFLGTYTLGPLHFYIADKGGEKTLEKLIKTRSPDVPPITANIISPRHGSYNDFWKLLQKDEKDGFFNGMAEQNGLVVLPDSITSIYSMAKREIAKVNQLDIIAMSKKKSGHDGFQTMHWGQLLAWMQELVAVIQDLPCAAAATAHLFTEKDKEGAVIERVPSVSGQFKYSAPVDFDEVYQIKLVGSTHTLHFKEHHQFVSKSRVFEAKSIKNPNMNDLATAYINGNTLKEKEKEKKETPVLAKKTLNPN